MVFPAKFAVVVLCGVILDKYCMDHLNIGIPGDARVLLPDNQP